MRLRLFLLAALPLAFAGCQPAETPPPTEEVMLILPQPGRLGDADEVRRELLDYIGTKAAPGTWITALDAGTMNPVAELQVSAGSRSYRLYGPQSRQPVKELLSRLDGEVASSLVDVDYLGLPSVASSQRKSDPSLTLRIVCIGSPCAAAMGFTEDQTPCDDEIAREGGVFSKQAMGDFPPNTRLAIVPPREDWRPPALRLRAINWWRQLAAARGAELLRVSTDFGAAMTATTPQWADPPEPGDACTEPTPPEAAPTVALPIERVETTPSPPAVSATSPRASHPAADRLRGPLERVAFVIDTSRSMAWEEDGAIVPNALPTVKQHARHLLQLLPLVQFAVIAFGGTADQRPDLRHYPWAFGPYLRDASPHALAAGAEFIDRLEAAGGTPTLDALRAAAELPGIDTICLYTDGQPSLGGAPDVILQYADQLREAGVVVNVIGCGVLAREDADFNAESFLQTLAHKTGGEYFALADQPLTP